MSGALARRAEHLYEAMNDDRARRLPAAVPAARHARRGHRGHAAPGPPLGARRISDDPDDGRRDRGVRPPPAALVRPRSGDARADGRDRARGPPPRVGAAREAGSTRRATTSGPDASSPSRPPSGRGRTGRELPAARRSARADRRMGRDHHDIALSSTTMSTYLSERRERDEERRRRRGARRREARARAPLDLAAPGLVAVFAAAALVAGLLTVVAKNQERRAEQSLA